MSNEFLLGFDNGRIVEFLYLQLLQLS